jgi:hypothetical protein
MRNKRSHLKTSLGWSHCRWFVSVQHVNVYNNQNPIQRATTKITSILIIVQSRDCGNLEVSARGLGPSWTPNTHSLWRRQLHYLSKRKTSTFDAAYSPKAKFFTLSVWPSLTVTPWLRPTQTGALHISIFTAGVKNRRPAYVFCVASIRLS